MSASLASRSTSGHGDSRDALGVALWIAQLVLFTVFAVTGFAKMTMPVDRLAPMMAWVTDAPEALVRFIGVAELAGALGVLLPSVTRVQPGLTSLAAVGLGVVMACATVVHLAEGEPARAMVPLVLGALAAFVAWGRYAASPIVSRRPERMA
jgi:uncharacterized membrane protein YphA (DoxX/SURF4 family)